MQCFLHLALQTCPCPGVLAWSFEPDMVATLCCSKALSTGSEACLFYVLESALLTRPHCVIGISWPYSELGESCICHALNNGQQDFTSIVPDMKNLHMYAVE